MSPLWRVWLAESAQQDFFRILRWTTQQFGARQARTYETTLRSALKSLAAGPDTLGCRFRPELGTAVATLHAARQGRKARHLIVFRASQETSTIEVLRILHDSMDLQRHLDS